MTLNAVAPGKLNLYLHITGKRDDGYHLLDSLVAFTEFGDELSVKAADALSLQVSGPFAGEAGAGDDNLVIGSARAIQQYTGCDAGAAISLNKQIPVGAGLGGGSSDAAITARLLNQLWQLNLSDEQLIKVLSPLGADMSVCVHGRPTIMRGIGDKLLAAPELSHYFVLLVNPMKALSTPDVYRAYVGDYRDVIDASDWLSAENDLTNAALSLCPEIGEVLNLLKEQPGVVTSRMCGSGATCFSLFDNDIECANARDAVLSQQPGWWAVATSLSH